MGFMGQVWGLWGKCGVSVASVGVSVASVGFV